MKRLNKTLKYKQRPVEAALKISGLSYFCSLLPLGFKAVTFLLAGRVGYYRVPYWAEEVKAFNSFNFMGAVSGLRNILSTAKKNKKLEGGEGDPITLEVLDRFTYIKLLTGEENLTEFRYFLKTTTGTWRLTKDKFSYYSKLQPGTLIRAAVVVAENTPKIVDLEILSEAKEDTASGKLNQVMDKVATEVKVISYRKGQLVTNTQEPLKELKYYLVVNNQLLPVTGGIFSQITLNQQYYPAGKGN